MVDSCKGVFHTERMERKNKHRGSHGPERSRRGWTISELVVVIAIISILLLLVLLMGWRRQIDRGYDAKRKDDLETIKIVFEEYYNDKKCYPPADALNDCGGAALQPYIGKIPCDPVTKLAYKYVPLNGNICTGYRVLTTLDDPTDVDVVRLGCHGDLACGFGDGYNYGISSGTRVLAPGVATPTPTPTPTPSVPPPTPTPTGTQWACAPQGTCNVYADPLGSGCPFTWADKDCSNQCDNPANRCRQ